LLYFRNLCELHKRRVKFKTILENQAFPQIDQIVPRSLLEFGLRPSEALASWLVWRKWFYDIDNRSAQETGYLFEPILASSLGGISYGAKNSPVKRQTDSSRSRQVDCIVDDGITKSAYEFKMRMTIAASGQGRFSEELEFPKDCVFSGYKPILIVLDETPSSRLSEITKVFANHGGECYVGDAAWAHLEEKSGPVMAIFIEKYVKKALSEIENSPVSLESISFYQRNNKIKIQVNGSKFEVFRAEIPLLQSEEDKSPIG
jgi:hypothetical protein